MATGALFICLLAALLASTAAADSIHGCGGFVEASSSLVKWGKASDAKLDYSHISVELCTVDGLVKERTNCAPNGYYFIPVYDKGSFVLRVRGPDGWSWKPAKVPIVVDHNGCNENADINFEFTGFSISGKVIGAVGGESCSVKGGGPSGVKIDLLSPADDVLASTVTLSTGIYSFTNITPGKYKLRASHPHLEVEVRGSLEVNLGFGNALVDDVFFVPGYDLHGFVVAQGNPIVGVHVVLHSDDVSEVHCPGGVGNSPRGKAVLCHSISDVDGKFTFRSLPCGVYELVPSYKGENTIFDVSPPSLMVSVEHRHLTMSQKFQVTGFSIGGRVIDGNGAGVDGAKVIVDGEFRSTSDSQGYYKLDQVTSKQYSIEAEKEHYKFNKLENYMVLPNMAHIDDISATYYDICGIVRMITTGSKTMVLITHGPENFKPQRKSIDENGSFCFEVPTGDYRVSVLPVESTNNGIMFSPQFVDVKVKSPLLNVEFAQAQVNVHGHVLCKEKCSPNISVSLVRLEGQNMQDRATVLLEHENCNFVFSKVFPGKYRVEVKHTSSLTSSDDKWCWRQSTVDIDVGTEDLTGIVFVQKGYWVHIISTHDSDAYIEQFDSSRMDLSIKKGSQKICMENPGEYELHFVNSCISFGSSSLRFDPLNPAPIYLTGKKYLLEGEIRMDLDLVLDANDLSEDIVVDAYASDGSFQTISTKFSSASDKSGNKGLAVYEYSIWADLGEEFTFIPRDKSTSKEKRILFYPKQQKVSVGVDGCQPKVPSIIARSGLYINGSVSPAQDGVNIKIIAMGESSYAPLLKGDLAFETVTGREGLFSAGPLYDDISYKVEASKPGHSLKQVGPSTFSCQKLSQIVVRINDARQDGKLFPSVLLSLSGEDGYRNNSVSGVGGSFSFDDLFPGSFYLRPLLKEYSFSPATVAIELESGESKVIDFLATRVAYSAMGSVALLSGQPKEGIYIEAKAQTKGYYEEATTDSMGNFRLRGLLPDTTYVIRVTAKEHLGAKDIERASPEMIEITAGSEDIRGLSFVVFERPENTILSGLAEGDNLSTLQPHLTVEIRLASDPSKVVSVLPLPLSCFFEISGLPREKLMVQLKSSLPSNSLRFQSDVLEVDLDKQPQTHAGRIGYKIEEDHHKQEITPAPVFPLIVGVSVIALFISIPRLKDVYQIAISMTPLGSNALSSKKEPRKQGLKRRVS